MPFETAPVRGVEVHYGVRKVTGQYGGDYGTKDGVAKKVYTYDYDELPAADDNNLVVDFPAYAKVLRVYTEVLEDITGLTSPTVQAEIGDYDSGADALSAATRGGFVIDETVASVGTDSAELVISLDGTGTATAGKLRTIVEYIPEGA